MNLLPALNIQPKTPLRKLIDQLCKTYLPVAVRNCSLIVNDIPPALSIGEDSGSVAMVVNGLLHSVVYNARESCIRVSAKEMYGRSIVITVKDSNSYNTYAVACSLQDVLPLAQKIGGDLNISSQRQRITTIAFRFPITGESPEMPSYISHQ